MFEEPVIVLEGQPLRVAFQTNLGINSGQGYNTYFLSDPMGGNNPPQLALEVGNTQWFPFPTSSEFSRPDNWRMKWYQGLIHKAPGTFCPLLYSSLTRQCNTTGPSLRNRTETCLGGGPRYVERLYYQQHGSDATEQHKLRGDCCQSTKGSCVRGRSISSEFIFYLLLFETQ